MKDFNLLSKIIAFAIIPTIMCVPSLTLAEPSVKEFSFTPLEFGIGPSAGVGQLVLPRQMLPQLCTDAVVRAVQSFDLGIIKPELKPDKDYLKFGEDWKTDVAPIGLQFVGKVDVKGDTLRLTIEAHLFDRGAGSHFRVYETAYSGKWFQDALIQRIKQELENNSAGK